MNPETSSDNALRRFLADLRAAPRRIVETALRSGMPLLGVTRIFGMYRLANSMALLDAQVRKLQPDQALGAKGFDNYSWHTDLPPGPPMVTGQQTVEFDLSAVEYCKTLVVEFLLRMGGPGVRRGCLV